MRLEPAAAMCLVYQSYPTEPTIDGVKVVPLKKRRAAEGWFMEYLRLNEGRVQGFEPPFDMKQLSISFAIPGRINAFHIHPKRPQDEIWCVISGQLGIWLADVREGSPTQGCKRQFILCGEEPALLLIPSGVAHGYKAGPDGAVLVYAMNDQFSIDDPNEGRLPWDYFGAELWEDNRG